MDADYYLQEVSRHIHLNPVRVNLGHGMTLGEKRKYLRNYSWNSYGGFVSTTQRRPFLRVEDALSHFAARNIQLNRFKGMKLYSNAQMTNRHIKKFCQIDEASQKLLEMAIDKFGLSARAYTRILKVARTIADIEGKENIETAHLSESIQYRTLDRNLVS